MWRLVIGAVVVPLFVGCATTPSRNELAEEYYNLGNAFYELERYDESFRYYNRALALRPELPAVSYNLARLYIDREDYLPAIDILLTLQRNDPQNLLVRETLGYAWYRAGNGEEAYRFYRDVAAEYPGRSDAVYNAARIAGELNRWDEALPILQAGIDVTDGDEGLYWLLATAAYERGDSEGALKALDSYAALTEGDVEMSAALADRYYEWSYYLPAIETYRVVQDMGEMSLVSQFRLAAATMLGTDEFDTALESMTILFGSEREGDDVLEAELANLQERLPDGDWALVEEAIQTAITPSEVPSGL